MPLLTLFALVTCVRTRLKGRKWPWVLFILFGVGGVSVNWATDAWQAHLYAFRLLGGSVMSGGPYSPWILGCSLPLGAIVFLARRRDLQAGPPAAPAPDQAVAA